METATATRRFGRAQRCVRGLTAGLALGLCLLLVLAREGLVAQVADTGVEVSGLLDAGRYADAEQLARRRLDSVTRGGAVDQDVADAIDHLVPALILNGRGASAEALELATRAVRLGESLADQTSSQLPALVNAGDVLSAQGMFDESIAQLQRAVTLATGRSPGETAWATSHLASALSAAGRFDAAKQAFEAAIRGSATPSSGDLEALRTMLGFTFTLQVLGNYDRSAESLRTAESLAQPLSADHPARVGLLNLVAQQRWFEGRVVDSKEASEAAVSVAERALRADHPLVAESIRTLASTLGDLGDVDQALRLKQRALEIASASFGPDHHVTAEYVHSLGLAKLDAGDYVTARDDLERALTLYRRHYGNRHQLVATAQTVLAIALERLGDFEGAVREQSRAVTTHEAAGGREHPFVATALVELASIRLTQERPDIALPLLERALAIRERHFGPSHRDVALVLTELASTRARLNQLRVARQMAARALTIWRGLDAGDSPEFATLLLTAADLEERAGQNDAARGFYEQALSIRRRVFGARHPLSAEAAAGYARLLVAAGDVAGALSAAEVAEDVGREHLSLMLRSLPERAGLDYAVSRPRGLDVLVSLAESSPRAAASALDAVIKARALVLDEVTSRLRSTQAGRETAFTSATSPLAEARRTLANLLVRGPGPLSAAEYEQQIESARLRTERAEKAIAGVGGDVRTDSGRDRIGSRDVLAALPADTALLSYVRYRRYEADSGQVVAAATARRGAEHYAAIVSRADRSPVVIPLGRAATLDRLVTRWRSDIDSDARSAGSAAASSSGRSLRVAMWDSVAPSLAGATRIFVVPDGSLGLVPLAALPVGADRYLVETGPILHYLSTERDVASMPMAEPKAAGLLVVGDPAFGAPAGQDARRSGLDAPGGCGSLSSAVFESLPGTRSEVAELVRAWQSADATAPLLRLTGRTATEAGVKLEAPRYGILHFATHGFFTRGNCGPARRSVRGVGGLARPGDSGRNPLSLSGLVLANANMRARTRPGDEDGILTAGEVAAMPLTGVGWAVLSACDTGVGDVRTSEGVFGLRRAFLTAGARTVIMSLWSVDDAATRRWMRALYQARLERHLSTTDALQAASLEVLTERRRRGLSSHPFYWASFVAVGDWR